jgi:hypothetical protein
MIFARDQGKAIVSLDDFLTRITAHELSFLLPRPGKSGK